MKNLINLFNEGLRAEVPFVLVTVVDVCGSAPQSAGARMIVFADKTIIGTVGGGCVEGEVIQEAIKMLVYNNEKEIKIIKVDLTDEIGNKDGDICGGSMFFLLEKISNN
ncbi:MAG TPA: XdhC family protein [bacterium]|nr:XdhC family protein [bacterium]HOL47374.1 XdhC family protein [bacterium]HPQ18893.1 XdhC family protein [bacterium]